MTKIYFQGTFGAYSHLAAISIDPKAEILPCKTFDECFNKASEEPESRIIIPESNRITGNIGIEYLIFKHRLNIYKEHFQKIEHNLLGQPGAKLKDIKEVYSHAQGLSQCSKFIKDNKLAEHIRADTAGSAEMISKKKDIKQSIQHHKSKGLMATVTTVKPPGKYGSLYFGKNFSVEAFQEKPLGDGGWINGGFFVLEPEVLNFIDSDETLWEQEPLKRLVEKRQLSAFPHNGFWQPMDTLRDKNLLEDIWQKGQAPWKVW